MDASSPWTRWATLLGTVAMGAALLLTLGLSATQSNRAAVELEQQQLRQLRGSLARTVRHVRDPQRAVQEVLEDEGDSGLIALAILGDEGVLAGVGVEDDVASLPTHYRVRDGDRVTAVVPLRQRRGSARRRGPEGRRLYVELEPKSANALRASGRRAVLAGVAASGSLLALAIFLWRRSLTAEHAAQQLAEQRHLAQLGTLSAVLGHELRNPLTSLKGNAQLLRRKLPPDSREADKADLIVAEAVRLERLTSRILAFARTGVERVDTPVRGLAEAVVDRVDGATLAACPDVDWSLDPDWVEQAVENLLRNAVQADPDGVATLTVTAGDALVFAVADRGPGIPEDQRRWAVEAFHTDKVQGTGLGLAIARRVAEQHGGSIAIDDHPGGGAVVTLTLGAA